MRPALHAGGLGVVDRRLGITIRGRAHSDSYELHIIGSKTTHSEAPPILRTLFEYSQLITDPRVCQNVLGLGRLRFDLFSKLLHQSSQKIQLVTVVRPPNRTEEFAVRDDLVGAVRNIL